ncbi:helix-turn-helix transcriptional regulator [Promicromonospora iranensis]|uniref:DNA-binding transcriptional regulator YafY n=1 Tax=Promicromonospora iranensis TaxID=1105144 RepID=A0ABU2CLE6_9MICO|nr:WYL domain-containing protein [Promicromonospora iranensis]MDR7382138.1 putative DNA-binding transcriptional regulator YafY [Promicromonospora iranensis]
MLETSARLLELLSLLQLKRDWTSSELAGRLGVSTRTVRADIGKLRSLGYPVDARPGVAGGYRLVAGTAMPPLLLDDDEAVAVAVGLGAVATRGLGVEETALTALAKLEQVLPSRLRRRVETVREATSAVSGAEPLLDPSVLGSVAAAIRGHERLRFGYTKPGGSRAARHTEPQRLVRWGSLWYLLAWDLDRADWRVFRVDRMVPHAPTGARFRPRVIPEDKVVDYVVGRVSKGASTYRARVLVHAPAAEVAAKVAIPVDIEVVDESTCRVELGADDPDRIALWMAQLDVDIEVIEGDEVAMAFDRLATRFRRAAGGASAARRPSR